MQIASVPNPKYKNFVNISQIGEDGAFLSQTTMALPSQQLGDEVLSNVDPHNQSLVSAPNKVEKILIAYAKQAKKMDMRRLKAIEWDILHTGSKSSAKDTENKENQDKNAANAEDGEKQTNDSTGMADGRNKMQDEATVNFTDLYSKLHDPRNRMPQKMMENLSVPLAFVALLHLCNEHSLALENVPDFTDFKIQQG